MTTLKQDWDAWRVRQEQKQHETIRQAEQRLKATKRPPTDREKEAIIALASCTFTPGTWEKKFAHSLYTFNPYGEMPREQRMTAHAKISERQAYWLARIVVRYRRQLGLSDETVQWWKNRAAEILDANGKQGMDVSTLGAELKEIEHG